MNGNHRARTGIDCMDDEPHGLTTDTARILGTLEFSTDRLGIHRGTDTGSVPQRLPNHGHADAAGSS